MIKYYLANYIGNEYCIILPENYNGENYNIADCAFYGYDKIESLYIGSGVLSVGSEVLSCVPTKVVWLTNTPPMNYDNAKGGINYVSNDKYTALNNAIVYPYLSSIFEMDGVKYVPISPSERTCHAIDCTYDSTAAKINIVETVSFKGVAMKVTEVMPYTFYKNHNIKEVSVSHIGHIGKHAFSNCSKIEFVSVSNLGDIGEHAFCNCDSIEVIEVSNWGDVGFQAFYDCGNIKTLSISNKGNIKKEAFHGCDTIEYAYISNQGDIESYAFFELGNAKKIVVSNYGEIKDMGFRNCDKVDTIIVANRGNIGHEAFYASGIQNLIVDNLGSIGEEAFEGCTIMTSLILGDSVKSLGVEAFRGCYKLQEAIIPNSVSSIGESCFYDCLSLSSVTLGGGIGVLPDKTFYNCKELQEITIPNSVNSIGESCFYDCSEMKCISIGDRVSFIGNSAFRNCSALINIKIGDGVISIGDNAFQNCSSLPEINIPKSTTKIGNYVFLGCSQLSDVIVKDRTTVLSLGSNGSSSLFANCPLDSVYIGGAICYNASSSNGYSPFYRNTSLRTVVITNREEQIYDYEFYGCTNLKNVTIGNGVKSIGKYAFSGCSSLTGFSFGSNMETIDAEAFSDCTKLTSITSYAAVPPTCGSQALDDVNKWECVLRVPIGYTAAYQAADQWKDFFFVEDVVELERYVLTYMVDGEVYYTDTLVHKETVTYPEMPVKEGYTFSGWDKILTAMPAEDAIINGAFIINKYLVTFKVGDEVIVADSLEYGTAIVVPDTPEKEGYTFDGWGDVEKEVPAHDVTYEGSYTVNTYNVYYYVGDELVHTAEVAYDEAIPEYVYEPTEEGYTFLGWIGDTYETMPAHDVTYIANIDDAIEELTIDKSQLTIYDLQGRKVLNTENLKGGVYIINGKQVLIK